MNDHSLPIEQTQRAFTSLGKALELCNSELSIHLDAIHTTTRAIERKPAEKPKEETETKAESAARLQRAQFQSDRAKFAKQADEFQLVAQMLGSSIGVGSAGAEGAKAASEAAKLRKDLVDVQEAIDRGLLDKNDAATALRELRNKIAKAEGKQAIHTGAGAGDSSRIGKLARAAIPAMGEGAKKGMAELASQASSVGAGAASMLASALPIAGGLGLFGLMLWGVVEKDRMRAEMGEVVNLAVAAGGNASSRGMKWMAGFQEKCQKFYGISRKEVQGIFKGYVEAGLSMDDMFKTIDKSLGEAGENALALSLASDKHFELSAGATSKAATQAVTNYGMDLGRATKLITDIEFQSHHAGMGVGNMINWTVSASANVRHLGVGIEEVASAAFAMKQQYASKGVDSEKWAKDSTTEMLGGMQGMGVGREMWAAEKMGMGKGIAGRNKLRDRMRQDPAMLKGLARLWKQEADVAGGGDEMQSRLYLEKQGFGFEGSKAVMTLGDESDKGTKVHGKKKEDKIALRKAYQEEGLKMSELKKKTNAMLAGFAKAGQGALQMLTGFMALVIVSVKALPEYFLGSKESAQRALAAMREQSQAISNGALMFYDGSKEGLGAIWDIVGPILEPMKRAWEFDPFIVHLSQDEIAAFEEADPGIRRDKIAAVMLKYGMSSDEVLKRAYQAPKSGTPEGLPLAMRPLSSSIAHGAPTKAPKPPPANALGAGAAPLVAPSPVTIQFNGKPIILGALGAPTLNLNVEWDARPSDKNLVVQTTSSVG